MKFFNLIILLACGLTLLLFSSCGVNKKNTSFLPPEYNLPDVKIGERKTFVYIDQSNGDSSLYDYYHETKKGQVYLICTAAYSEKKVSDSAVYQNGKLLETYSHLFENTTLTKAVIIRDTIIESGKKFGTKVLEENFSSDSIVDAFRAEFEFLKDTIFTWQKTPLPTFVIKATYYASIKSKIIPSIHTDYETSVIAYQAKGIGTIRFRALKTADNKIKNIDLVQIRSSKLE